MRGRCPGCGEMGSGGAVAVHMVTCRKFAQLYREHPERCMPPEQEYQRWLAEDKAGETEERIAAKVAAGAEQRSAMADRFRTPNILEDE